MTYRERGSDMKRVVLFFAEGTEEVEALTPVDILRRAGAEVVIAGVGGTVLAGSHGIRITADIAADEINGGDYDMAILPGGMPGTKHLDASCDVERCLAEVSAQGGFLAAICAAPMVLGRLGYLAGKSAVCYPGFESCLEGASISKSKVCRDGKVITAAGAGAAMEFALALVGALFGEQTEEQVRRSVLA